MKLWQVIVLSAIGGAAIWTAIVYFLNDLIWKRKIKLKHKYNNMSTKSLFAFMAIFAFASIICFFHINSYVADKNGINWLFTAGGIGFGLTAAYFLYRVSKQGGTGNNFH